MITVLFSCKECGLKDVPVEVRARESPEEDVILYVEKVIGKAVMEKHTRMSLLCDATTIQDLKVPIDPTDPHDWIGKQTSIVPPSGT